MQAKVKQNSRYGVITAFSGVEFLKREWRKVPAGFEEQALAHPLLETRQGKAEKEIEQKQAEDAIVKTTKARLVADYKEPSLRTLGGHEYFKDRWVDVPEGYEESARNHELLEIWEIDEPEPKLGKPASGKKADKATPTTNKSIFGKATKKTDKNTEASESSEDETGSEG